MQQALQALHAKKEAIEWWTSQHGREFALGILEDLGSTTDARHAGIARTHPSALAADGDPSRYANSVAAGLRFAETFWVDGDMVGLVNGACDTMPLQHLKQTDAPVQHGFCLLESPIYLTKRDGTDEIKLCVNALRWRQSSVTINGRPAGGYEITWYSDKYDLNDTVLGDRDNRAAVSTPSLPKLMPLMHSFWRYDQEYAETMSGDPPVEGGMLNLQQWTAAFWTLVQQPLACRTEHAPPGQLRKRMERLQMMDKHVTVITLRHQKKAPGDEPARTIDYSHRFLVRGHWRNQYLPSTGGHRQQWINGYIKGPEDAPFIMREKVYSWTR